MWSGVARLLPAATLVVAAVALPPGDRGTAQPLGPKNGAARRVLKGRWPAELSPENLHNRSFVGLKADTPSAQANNVTSIVATIASKKDALRGKQNASRAKLAAQFAAWQQYSALARWRYQQEHPLANESDIEEALKLEQMYGMHSNDSAEVVPVNFAKAPPQPPKISRRPSAPLPRAQDALQNTIEVVAEPESARGRPGSVPMSAVPTVDEAADKAVDTAAVKALEGAAVRLGRSTPGIVVESAAPRLELDSLRHMAEGRKTTTTASPSSAAGKSHASVRPAQSRCVVDSTRSPAERWERERQLSLLQGVSSVSDAQRRWGLRPRSAFRLSLEHGLEATSRANTDLSRFSGAEKHTFARLTRLTMSLMMKQSFERIVKTQDDSEMFRFIKDMVNEVGGEILDEGGLAGIVPFYSGSRDMQSFVRLMEELQAIAHLPDGWLRMPVSSCFKTLQMGYGPQRFPAGVGSVASLNEQGYQAVAFTRRSPEMAKFIRRTMEREGFEVVDEGGLSGLVPFYSGECGTRSFQQLVDELTQVASMQGRWVRSEGGGQHGSLGSKLQANHAQSR